MHNNRNNSQIPGSQIVQDGGIAQIIKQYGIAILPWEATAQFDFTAKGQIKNVTLHIDSSYDFIITERVVVDTKDDLDTVFNFIQINTQTSFIQNNLPLAATTRFTGWPVDWQLGVPANADLVTQIQNGQTTDAHSVFVTYRGWRVPAGYGRQIRSDLFVAAGGN